MFSTVASRTRAPNSRRLSSLATSLGLETAMARVSPCRVAATTGEAKARTTTNGLRIYLSSQPAYVHIPERLGRGDVDLGEGLGGAAACVCALGLVFNAPIGGGAAPPLAPPPPAPACRCTAALCRPVGSRPWGILCHGMLEPDASGISDASTARNQSNGLLRAQRTSDGCAHVASGVVRRFDTHDHILICLRGAQKAQGRRGRVAVRAWSCDAAFDDIWAYNPHAELQCSFVWARTCWPRAATAARCCCTMCHMRKRNMHVT